MICTYFIFLKLIYLLFCLLQTLVVVCGLLVVACGLLVAACRLLSCSMNVGSSSLTRHWTHAPCIGSAESYPLDHQGSPWWFVHILKDLFLCILHFKVYCKWQFLHFQILFYIYAIYIYIYIYIHTHIHIYMQFKKLICNLTKVT